jgi:addiction module HigA family antidote
VAVTALHPGAHLAEELRKLGMSAAAMARNLDVPTIRIAAILNGRRVVTDTALRFAHFFGTTPEFPAQPAESLPVAPRSTESRKIDPRAFYLAAYRAAFCLSGSNEAPPYDRSTAVPRRYCCTIKLILTNPAPPARGRTAIAHSQFGAGSPGRRKGTAMLPEQWEIFKRAARREKLDRIPMALIIDSPWIPGYLGIGHMDYFLDPELWFQSNLKIMREFPDIIFVPSWWMEYGMAAEPSVLGAKIKFWKDNTPSEYHTLYHLEDMDNFPEYEVEADAFAALTLHRYQMQKQRILDHGYILPMVTSRGPLCTAGFVRGTTNFMIDLVENPEGAHRLIDLCTRVVIDWLKAQQKVLGDGVESIFILDDIVGFINEEHYLEFAHPYLKRICDAFPDDWIKVYHNDAEVDACLDHLPDAGFGVLNWGKQKDIREVKERVGDRMCLMGNVNPLEIAVRGTPGEVREATLDVLEGSGGEGVILSVGGGTSPGMPRENIVAMLDALEEFNNCRVASA